MDLKEYYKDKRVFLTGHTGFKGAWLAWWLKEMGAEVCGYSLPPAGKRGNLFELLNLTDEVQSYEEDIRDFNLLSQRLKDFSPDIVIHLAAQALVLTSYEDPLDTYSTNVMGTANVLEATRKLESVKSVLVVTTDKCYQNKEWYWPYRENDPLGGHDPYSSSKAAAELLVSSYRESFFKGASKGLASLRAGNVIGGGDFAEYRIIPDIFEAISENREVELRNPNSVRPWQHVLDALYGYLLIGAHLGKDQLKFSTAFNFAPFDNSNDHTVKYITETFIKNFGRGKYKVNSNGNINNEARLLRLDPTKAQTMAQWEPLFSTEEAIKFTVSWYRDYLETPDRVRQITTDQIQKYMNRRNGVC